MKFFKSLKNQATSFLDEYKTKNPATYAAAEQAIGGILIADGLVGLENPFDGQKKRPGIFGSLIGVIVGLVILFGAGFFVRLTGIDKLTANTTATVVSISQEPQSGDSGQSCALTAKYTVEGVEYSKRSAYSSTSQCNLATGQSIPINYDPANPANYGYETGTIKTFLKFFPWFGLLIVISSSITFVIRLLSIIFGWKLLRQGRKDAKDLPPGTDLKTVIAEIRKSFTSNIFHFGSGQSAPPTVPPPEPPIK